MDLLTHSVNVPAEREKLRVLRNEIAADVEHREAIQRKYSPRGFLKLSYVQQLETEGKPGHGQAPNGALRAGSDVGVPAAVANVLEAQAGFCVRCGGACRMGEGGMK